MGSNLPAWAPVPDILNSVPFLGINPGSSAPILLNAGQMSQLIDANGDIEGVIDITPDFDLAGAGASSSTNVSRYLYHGTSADGEFSLQFVPGLNGGVSSNVLGTFTMTVRGAVIFSGSTSPVANISNVLSWQSGQRIFCHFWYKPSLSAHGDSAGFRIVPMGCTTTGMSPSQNFVATAASGGALAPFSAFAVCSKLDGSAPFSGTLNSLTSYITGTEYGVNGGGAIVIFGDSKITSYEQASPMPAFMRSGSGWLTKPRLVLVAHPGALIAHMQANLTGSAYATLSAILSTAACVVNQTKFNDVLSSSSAQTIFNALQAFNVAVKALTPSSCKYIEMLCQSGQLSGGQLTVWQTLNSPAATQYSIQSMTGVDAFVTGHIAPISTNTSWVPGNAMPAIATSPTNYQGWQQVGVPDPTHQNNAARAIEAVQLANAITAVGLGALL